MKTGGVIMNIKNFLSKRLNLILFITLIFGFLGLLLSYFVPNYLYNQNLKDVEAEITYIGENHETIDKLIGTNNLYVNIDGESTMLTANGYIDEIDEEIEGHLIHWSHAQEANNIKRFIYHDDFQNEEFIYYIYIPRDDYYVITFADTYDIVSFVNTLRLYTGIFISVVYLGTLLFALTIFNNSLIKRYSQYNPITNLNTQQAFYMKFARRNLAKYHIAYHNIFNFADIVDACGVRYHDNILKMMSDNIQQAYDIDSIYQLSPSEYLIISEQDSEYQLFEKSLNTNMDNHLLKSYEFKAKTVLIENELLKNIDIQTLTSRLAYAYSKIKESTEPVTEVTKSTLDDMELEIYYQSNLERALKEEELENYYQVKVDPKTNTIIGAEALSRWLDKDGIISPTKYINIAETSGLIYEIDLLSFKNSCRFISELTALNIVSDSFKISTNFSPITLKNLAIQTIKDILHETNASPNRISIEITESVMLEFEAIQDLLLELSTIGFTIEIDDFSAGNSSFTVLPLLNASYLKIDMAVLPKDISNEKETMIYESLVDIATRLNMRIISEGVETKDLVDYLMKLNIHGIQGYYYSKPIPQQEFIEFIKNYK